MAWLLCFCLIVSTSYYLYFTKVECHIPSFRIFSIIKKLIHFEVRDHLVWEESNYFGTDSNLFFCHWTKKHYLEVHSAVTQFKFTATYVNCVWSYSHTPGQSASQTFFLGRHAPAPHMPASMRSFSFEIRFLFAGTISNKDYLHFAAESCS